jgi:RNA ligase (TIGR02306 family)
MNKLASIEIVKSVETHPNADALDIATVLGYQCIVGRGSLEPGQAVVLIQPDTVLPDEPWAELFRKRSNRVKAIKLRGAWSFGIAMSVWDIPSLRDHLKGLLIPNRIGNDISDLIGVTKYEPPVPQDLSAVGYLPRSMPKTDEERFQNLERELPYGKHVHVTLKIDGQSATYFCIRDDNGGWRTGICSRSLEIKPDSNNNYTAIERKYNILQKLKNYCMYHNVSLALRGEIYGGGVQAFESNPHAKLPLDFAAFSVWNHDTLTYEGPSDPHYYEKVAAAVVGGIPVVPMIERDALLTKDMIAKYSAGIDKIDGKRFEGVVVKYEKSSFKIINLSYDERK